VKTKLRDRKHLACWICGAHRTGRWG
jgi:hypothetical protein